MVKERKPTGSGTPPWDVQEARDLHKLIEARGGLRFIDDSDFIVDDSLECKVEADDVQDHISISSDDHGERSLSRAIPPLKTEDPIYNVQTVRSGTQKPSHKRSEQSLGNAANLLKMLTNSLDPSNRDRSRNQQQMDNFYFLSLNQQIRDANGTIDALRREVADVQARLHKSERHCDYLKMQLDLKQDHFGRQKRGPRKRKQERITRYPDGGEYRQYLGSSDDDELFATTVFPFPPSPPMPGVGTSISHYSYTPSRASKVHSDLEASHSLAGCAGSANV